MSRGSRPALVTAMPRRRVKLPAAPRHLRTATKRWWRAIVGAFELEAHHLKVLQAAAEAWDRAQEAREAVTAEGILVKDRWGQLKANPACNVERDQRALFGRLVAQLDLPLPEPGRGRGGV